MTRLDNGDSAQWWAAVNEGRLILQKCSACGAVQFPPRYLCATCWHEGPAWIEASGRGRVESATVVHRAPLPAFRDKVPYVLAAIRLDEGPRIISTIVGEAAHEAVIGDAVEVVFLDPSRSGDPRLPCFRLA